MNPVIAHIDMDCFFCSCELKRNKDLYGKPVIVGGTGNRGVVSAANYEARIYGVYSATPIKTARKLCREGIFLPVDMAYYKSESQKIMKILSLVADDMRQVSVDEAYLDLSFFAIKFRDLEEMAESIQKKITKETGLSCSVGIAQSTIVAKIASDFRKPGGITIVEDPQAFLSTLPIKKIPGIGKKSVNKYYENGIETIGDLAKKDTFWVLDHFGMQGVSYQNVALGNDRSRITKKEVIKSISRENTLQEDTNDIEALRAEILELSNRVYEDLKSRDFRTVSLKIRYSDFTTVTRDMTFKTHSHSLLLIQETALDLFTMSYDECLLVRLVGVRLSHLTAGKDMQRSLIDYC